MSMGGGGGGQQGGSVVQYTAPWAAELAGTYGVDASMAAMQANNAAMNNALNSVNKLYQDAKYTLQPYRTTGVQALNKLNQYLGLDPYNPGAAPKLQSAWEDNDIKSLQQQGLTLAKQYLPENITKINQANPNDPALLNWNVGSVAAQLAGDDKAKKDLMVQNFLNSFMGAGGSLGGGLNSVLDQRNQAYKAEYDANLPEWEQNKKWYDQYSAEGPLTSTQIADKITNLPGYAAQLDQGTQAIAKNASSKGYLGSGRVLKELMSYGQNTLSQFYGDELSRLAGLAGQGAQAASQTSNNAMQQGSSLASLYQSIGENNANALLAAGNARAQATIAANQKFDVIGGSDGGGGMGGIGGLLGGVGSLVSAFKSSKELKDKTSTPSTAEILDNVSQMSLDKWKYKGIDREHIGPYAEQFQELFGVGDGKTINIIDAVGVLLGAVKELNMQVKLLQENK